MKYRAIEAKKAEVYIGRSCKLFDVSESGFYSWKKREPSQHQKDEMVLLTHIKSQFTSSNETYGSPRMTVELKEIGLMVGRHRVARMMRQNGLKALMPKRFKRTTDSDHNFLIAPNILNQDFTTTAPNQKRGVDISYIWTSEGWLYLAIVIDFYSRKIIGFETSDRLKKDLAITVLKRAIAIRRPSNDIIHHSDRGSQYCSYDYQNLLKDFGFTISMSGKGNCYDNAMVETVFKTIKSELIWRNSFKTRDSATNDIAQYIYGFYNSKRRHSALGYQSPIQFENQILKLAA